MYAFNDIAIFTAVHDYVATTNDTEWLLRPHPRAPGQTLLDVVVGLATRWRSRPRTPHSPFLVDYGSDAQVGASESPPITQPLPVIATESHRKATDCF